MPSLKTVLLILAGLALGLLVLIFISALSFGYFPKLGESLGLGGTRDLGVTYTEDDYLSAKAKFDAALETETVDQVFTDAELTALLNSCTESVCVVNDIQIRTSADGMLELSGAVDRDEVTELLTAVSDSENADFIESIVRYLPPEPSIYLKTELTGQEDMIMLDLTAAEISGFDLDSSTLNDLSRELESTLIEYLAQLPGTQIISLSVTESGVDVEADFHEIVTEVND